MPDRQYTLEQLEHAARTPSRQIRELVRLGILPAPSSRGRGASYGPEHLDRLRAWKRLRRESPAGTTNEQIRILLNRLQDSGLLRAIGEGTIPFALVDDQKEDVTIADAATPGLVARLSREEPDEVSHPQRINEPALDYLRSIRRSSRAAPVKLTMPARSARPQLEVNLGAAKGSGAQLTLERLFTALHDFTTNHAANVRVNQAKSETWQRVTVGKDLEIAARGPLTPDEIQLLETVGQLLQQAIYKKSSE